METILYSSILCKVRISVISRDFLVRSNFLAPHERALINSVKW